MIGLRELSMIVLCILLFFAIPVSGTPLVNYTSPTPANGTIQATKSVQVNISIIEANLSSLIFNWNGTNHTLYNDSLILMMNLDNRSVLNENGTFTVDVSKYGNNGTVILATYNASGYHGGAFQFDGVNGSINAGNGSSLNTSLFTFSLWARSAANVSNDWSTIIAK